MGNNYSTTGVNAICCALVNGCTIDGVSLNRAFHVRVVDQRLASARNNREDLDVCSAASLKPEDSERIQTRFLNIDLKQSVACTTTAIE